MNKEDKNTIHKNIDLSLLYITGRTKDFEKFGSCPLYDKGGVKLSCQKILECASYKACEAYQLNKEAGRTQLLSKLSVRTQYGNEMEDFLN